MDSRLKGGFLALAIALAGIGGVAAEDASRAVPDNAATIQLSFAPIVRRVAPAVVNVYASRVVQESGSPFSSDPLFQRFFGNDGSGPPTQRIQRSLGSGVLIDASGIIVTNNHVIARANEIRVALSDRREFNCDVILKDERTDLAVLKIRDGDGNFPFVEFADSDGLEVGDLVLAIGDPFGVGQTVTSGIVSALARTKVGVSDYQFFIQTDAAINPGNSGGALIDMSGRLVGINTAIFSRTGDSSGIGFAIPSNMVRVVAQSARDGGHVRLPWTGVSLQAVTPEIADSLGLPAPRGVLVARVTTGSAAAKAGLKPGDLIVSVDSTDVDDPSAFNYRVATKGIGATVTLGVMRKNRQYAAQLALEAAPETVPRAEVEIGGYSPLSGVKAVNLSPAVAEELSYDGDPQGVILTDVASGTSAEMAGFAKGDVVLAVNGVRIDSTRRLRQACAERVRYWEVSIERNGRVLTTRFRG